MVELTHVDATGQANMVDVSDKASTLRLATAVSLVYMNHDTLLQVKQNYNKKGDVISAAKLAGIMAAKRCSDLIPLCHPLLLTRIDVNIELNEELGRIEIYATCGVSGQTGVEMESLTAASVAALTIFDMCKASDPEMIITNVKVLRKSGGKTGEWSHSEAGKYQMEINYG